ncbi:zinc-ribbon domain-containing protein [uncultured Ramlibacter sp.]|uniref:zinc ribbon domain-containing protein n=1 Tax=uncultured Ramlibacter sp. TaxID=260755 RepID=UPI002610D27F|nr:zinc-ribbon domain-containing protein [uncultured Ramlibacter sp.]
MALVACTDCGAQISDKAPTCIKCGAPRGQAADLPGVVTTQQTAKKYKGLQLVAVLLCAAGTVSCVAKEIPASALLWTLGFVLYVAARFSAWWRHG